MPRNPKMKRTYMQTVCKKTQVLRESMHESPIFQGDVVWHLRTQKYMSLHMNRRVLACMCDVPVVMVCEILGVSETFMKKNRSMLSIHKWPHSYLCYDECFYISLERDKLIAEVEAIVKEQRKTTTEEDQRQPTLDEINTKKRRKKPYFQLYDYRDVDHKNLIDILKQAKHIAKNYNLPGYALQNATEEQQFSEYVKFLFGVDFPIAKQKVNWNKGFLKEIEEAGPPPPVANNDEEEDPIEEAFSDEEKQEEDMDTFVQNVLWTPISEL